MNFELLRKLRHTSEAELYRQLYTDPLTGALNRRAFEMLGRNRDWTAIVDADSLKWINDHLGHRAGDQHLCKVAQILIHKFGANNVHRISGDEFVVFGDDGEKLHIDLEACRESFQGFSFGIGKDMEQADRCLRLEKSYRARIGLRAQRGRKPLWIR